MFLEEEAMLLRIPVVVVDSRPVVVMVLMVSTGERGYRAPPRSCRARRRCRSR